VDLPFLGLLPLPSGRELAPKEAKQEQGYLCIPIADEGMPAKDLALSNVVVT